MPKRDDLLRFLHGELRTLEKMLDKPLPLGSAADRKAALRSVRAMRERVWNEGRTAGVMASGELSGLPTEIDRAAGVLAVGDEPNGPQSPLEQKEGPA